MTALTSAERNRVFDGIASGMTIWEAAAFAECDQAAARAAVRCAGGVGKICNPRLRDWRRRWCRKSGSTWPELSASVADAFRADLPFGQIAARHRVPEKVVECIVAIEVFGQPEDVGLRAGEAAR